MKNGRTFVPFVAFCWDLFKVGRISLWSNDQAQRQPPESAGGAQGRLPNHPRLANGKRGGCSLQRSG